MKLPTDTRLGDASTQTEFLRNLVYKLSILFRDSANQVNNLSDGYVDATNATTTHPTTGNHKQGDIVRYSEPTELGTLGNKYVITGWICVTSGTTGGTWKEMRVLTGG